MYHFVFPAPELKEQALQLCMDTVTSMKPVPEFLVLRGSLPLSAPTDFYGRITRAANVNNVKVVLDVSGTALQAPLDEGCYLAKLNRKEFLQLGFACLDEPEGARVSIEDLLA